MIFSTKVDIVKTWLHSNNRQMWLACFAQSKRVLKKDRKSRNQRIRRSLLICGRRFCRSGIWIWGRMWGRRDRCMMRCRNILASAISSRFVSMWCPISRVCRHERCVGFLIVLAFLRSLYRHPIFFNPFSQLFLSVVISSSCSSLLCISSSMTIQSCFFWSLCPSRSINVSVDTVIKWTSKNQPWIWLKCVIMPEKVYNPSFSSSSCIFLTSTSHTWTSGS